MGEEGASYLPRSGYLELTKRTTDALLSIGSPSCADRPHRGSYTPSKLQRNKRTMNHSQGNHTSLPFRCPRLGILARPTHGCSHGMQLSAGPEPHPRRRASIEGPHCLIETGKASLFVKAVSETCLSRMHLCELCQKSLGSRPVEFRAPQSRMWVEVIGDWDWLGVSGKALA